jgi:hypothetical protein
MKSKYFVYFLVALLASLGWNVFLIKRDQKMFEAYNQPTPKERFCKQQAQWHPDCNVE